MTLKFYKFRQNSSRYLYLFLFYQVMIMDSDTTTSLSLSCPQSEIMKKEVFLFEYLHNRGAANNALGFMKCVVLLRPEKVRIK